MKIGFFDTGLGGIVVLQAVAKELPEYDYVFYGDTANIPYGDKPEEEIYRLTKNAVTELFNRDCKLVILACNTASAETLRKLQDNFLVEEFPDRRILGVIIPAVESLIDSGAKQTILLATVRTINSNKYTKELSNRNASTIAVHGVATPSLVPLIELNDIDTAVETAVEALENKQAQLVGEIDSVVLGCTHYALLKEGLRSHFGETIQFISQDEIIPKKLKKYLADHPEIEQTLTKTGTRNIVLSKHREDYDAILADLLGGALLKE